MEIITRAAARSRGLKFYFTGKPCKHGHVAQRSTKWKICVECDRERASERYARKAGKINAARKVRYANDPSYRSASHARVKKWVRENKQKRKIIKDRWLNKNREKHNAGVKRWAEANKDKKRAHNTNRKARVREADGHHNAADIARIFKQQRGKCAYCRIKLGHDYHVDHIKPIAAGGSNWPSNLQLTCGPSGNRCNLRKNDKDPIDFQREHGRLI